MPIYEIVEQIYGGQILKRIDDDGQIWWIAMDEFNSDYQAYLKWLENPTAQQETPTIN